MYGSSGLLPATKKSPRKSPPSLIFPLPPTVQLKEGGRTGNNPLLPSPRGGRPNRLWTLAGKEGGRGGAIGERLPAVCLKGLEKEREERSFVWKRGKSNYEK